MDFLPYQWTEFQGGITDNYIDTVQSRYQYADNFLVTENRKLYTRPGSTIWDAINTQIPVGAQRINALIDHYDTLLTISGKKVYHVAAGTWSTLQGPTSNDVFTAGDIASRILWSDWNKHTYITNDDWSPVMRIHRDGSSVLKVRNAGLPLLASLPVCTPTAGTENYLYKFMYVYSYYVGTVNFIDFGPTSAVEVSNATAPNSAAIAISAIPVLANGTTNNYDTTVIKVRIYRTITNGTTFFYVGEVTNGTTTFSDNIADTTIANNAVIYTDSGELEHSPPPLCKALHITDTIAFYGNIKTTAGEILSNRVQQSIPDDPDSCPGELYVDLDDEIIAISSVGQTPVVLCKKSIYRLDNFFLGDGTGLLTAQEIESTVGCISATSVVQIQRGIVFAGEGGFYFTDGWEVRKLSQAFNERYSQLVITDQQKERIYGTFDRKTKRVYWSVQETGESDVNKIYVLDSRYGLGVAGDDLEDVQVCFTNISNATYFRPTAIIFINGELIRGDTQGYIFKHQDTLTSDPLIDSTKAFSLWDIVAIPWKFRSMATSFGTNLKRKFVPNMAFTSENDTNVSVQIRNINDVGRQDYPLIPIRFRKNCRWGDVEASWGSEIAIWNFTGIIEESRRFQSEGLRCAYKQLELSNAYVQICTSDHLGTATTNTITDVVTLDLPGTYSWPSNMADYYIYFIDDNYTKKFKVLSNNATTLNISNPDNLLASLSGTKFIIKGYPKNEVLNLISISLWYAYLGEPNQYDATSAGSTPA